MNTTSLLKWRYATKQFDPSKIISSDKLQIIKVPGNFWHGTKTIGNEPSLTVYFINNMYNYEDPDEERISWNDPSIIDPRTKQPYDWNSVNK